MCLNEPLSPLIWGLFGFLICFCAIYSERDRLVRQPKEVLVWSIKNHFPKGKTVHPSHCQSSLSLMCIVSESCTLHAALNTYSLPDTSLWAFHGAHLIFLQPDDAIIFHHLIFMDEQTEVQFNLLKPPSSKLKGLFLIKAAGFQRRLHRMFSLDIVPLSQFIFS